MGPGHDTLIVMWALKADPDASADVRLIQSDMLAS